MAENEAGQTRSVTAPTSVNTMRMGTVVFDSTSITGSDHVEIDVGFQPRKIVWSNDTDRVEITWREGMDDGTCIKAAAGGTRTLEESNGVTLTDNGFQVSQNASLGAIAASKTCRWEAHR